MIMLSDSEFVRLRDYVQANFGIDLSKKRMLIQGRLASVIQQYGMDNFSDYIDLVTNDKSGVELQMMLNRLTTNLTFFLREKEHFTYLQEVALPHLDKTNTHNDLRIWSAGCSSGEEPYTIAMTVLDYYEKKKGRCPKIALLASDISQQVLSQAQRAVYAKESLKDVPPDWIEKYFDKLQDDNYQVSQRVRDLVTFRIFNLMDPFRFTRPFEIIFCRNVMIYFDKQRKTELVHKYYQWTEPGGFFFISHSENISRGESEYTMLKPSIFQK